MPGTGGSVGTSGRRRVDICAIIVSLDGSQAVEGARSGPVQQSESIGRVLADELLTEGGEEILDEIRTATGDVG